MNYKNLSDLAISPPTEPNLIVPRLPILSN